MSSLRRVNVSGLLTLAALLAAWEIAIASGAVHFSYLPAPTKVAAAVWSQLSSGELVRAAGHTAVAVLLAWLLAMVIGVVGGVLLGLWRPARLLFTASIDVMRTLPVVALVPVAVLVLGFSTTMEIAVAAVAAVWPILLNTLGGVQAVHPRLHDVADVLRLTPIRRVRSIVLPSAAPLILVGARLGLSIALIIVVVAEMVGNPSGLGYEIVQWQQALRPDAMFADVLAIGVLGVAFNATLVALTARLAPDVFDAGERA